MLSTEILNPVDDFEDALLVREESYNQTAVESCFVLAD
jgi:hypothetical protein